MKKGLHIIQVFTVVVFFLLIVIPYANEYVEFFENTEGTENRSKVKRPVLNLSNLDKYSPAFDAYYNDNFSLRNNLIRFYNVLEFKLFNVSPVPNTVVVGKDGWLFANKSKYNYAGLNQFSLVEMEQIKQELRVRTKWCESRNIKYYVAIVPNKMNVYSSFLPRHIIKKRDSSRYDQFAALMSLPGVNVIDVKENLLKHLNEDVFLYQKTDDHWNELGAYYGYQAIMNKVSMDFSELKTKQLTDYQISTSPKTGNMAFLSNLEDYYIEDYIELNQIEKSYAVDGVKKNYEVPQTISVDSYEIVKTNEKGEPIKCLVIRDSFGLFLVKFLQDHFQSLTLIHDEWKYRMRTDIFEQEEPDIIINVILETYIDELLKNPFVEEDLQ